MYDATRINQDLFVGGFYGDVIAMRHFVRQNNVGCVVSLIDSDVAPIKRALYLPDGDHLHVHCEDDAKCGALADNLEMLFNYLWLKIHNEHKTVLIHCHAGVSRSATLAIYYIMRTNQIDYEQAFQYVYGKRAVHPSEHFVELLKGKCVYSYVDNKLVVRVE
ncbi:ORF98 PTP-2 [Cydia pomonella granulovirus]|uniref:ORF98 PTP-2 n=3 Tax=Cydia pomonella granulosis virus TaxID=28289 RepID=Q91EV7_GVCPM|nr:ORF98 PTP-2 [Cydia pomonella granulovirus]AAK70758.1 ORF98 PTP-2 [Cydia pomonella granulovirus]AIU36745.1 ORF98 ptp-2 [Cydia pomonella granulovirus]AIU37024.1 ORF98 ptp-2 [Cydia pomonella granulovirus]AIU37166.1 ORF98 ptp-2 [Cydia pomonella granulovirus]AIU37305.1 ORF98 ptp-2 [Cydia pomonella granulovirus]